MYFGLTVGLTAVNSSSSINGMPQIFARLGARDGFAIDFRARRMLVRDSGNPVNNFDGDPTLKLTKRGADAYSFDPIRGLDMSAARDFAIALSTDLFPYNPAACTVFIKYRLNAEISAEQRYLMMLDNAGTDRFAAYAPANIGFRFVTGDGAAADIATSSLTAAPDVEYTALFGADLHGKTYVDSAGTHADTSDTLAASTPSHLGIGSYPDQVLRVLDGYISEIAVVCAPVPRSERLSLDFWGPPLEVVHTQPRTALDILGSRDGFAIDFVARQMKVNDMATPTNAYLGDPEALLTKYGSDPYEYDPARGLRIDAARDFSIALSTSLFPFNPSACTVYVKYRLNAETSTEQRYLFFTDNGGQDRFTTYSVPGEPFRFVTGDGSASDIAVSSMGFAADTEHRAVFGCDHMGKTYIDDAGVQTDTTHVLATSTPSHVGIGGYNDRVLRVLDGYITEIAVITEPMPPATRKTLEPFFTYYKAEGDSHTYNTNEHVWGVGPSQFYPQRVAAAMGPNVVVGNFGWSGDSSAEMVHQLPDFFLDGRPDIATIYAGANDGAIDIIADTVPTATSFSVQYNLRTRLEPGGFVQINGEQGRIAARADNLITLEAPLSAAPSVGDTVTPDTQANIEFWIDEVSARGVPKIAVIGYHFINFATIADTPEREHPVRETLRNKQKAAAASRGVPYIDTYAHMAARISSGEVTLGDDLAWHVGIGNTHLNVAGEQAIADAVHGAFVALGWSE